LALDWLETLCVWIRRTCSCPASLLCFFIFELKVMVVCFLQMSYIIGERETQFSQMSHRLEIILEVLPTLLSLELCQTRRGAGIVEYGLLLREMLSQNSSSFRMVTPREPYVHRVTEACPSAVAGGATMAPPPPPLRIKLGGGGGNASSSKGTTSELSISKRKRPRYPVQWEVGGYDTDEWNEDGKAL